MNEKPTLVEHHHTWLLLSDGSVVTMGSPLFNQYAGQQPRVNTQPSGPRTVDRREFDAMAPAEKQKVIDSKTRIVDPGEDERKAKAARVQAELAALRKIGSEIRRESWEKMTASERDQVIREGARIID
jgi:hypothetical protein